MPYTIVVVVHVNAMTMIKTTVVAGIDPFSVIQTFKEKFERNSNILKHFTGFPAGTEIACMMTACKVRIAIWTVKSLLPLELLLILVWLPL